MASVPSGTIFAIASVFANPLPFTAASNAAEVVLEMDSTAGLAINDVVEVTSGWGLLNKRAARIKAVAANDSITLERINTDNEDQFPPGSGAGTVRKVSTWQTINKVTAISTSGGDPVNVAYKYLESDVRFNKNDGFNAQNVQLTIDADTIGEAGYTALQELTSVQTDTILRMVTRSGQRSLLPATVALNEAVQMSDGQINTVACAFNGNNRLTRYPN